MTTDPLREKDDIEAIKEYFLKHGRERDYAMFVLGINTALSISDLLGLRWDDVLEENGVELKERFFVKEKKSKRTVVMAMNGSVKTALNTLLKKVREGECFSRGDYIFGSYADRGRPITRFRAYQIITRAAAKLELSGNMGCQSMKKTFEYYALNAGIQPLVVKSGMEL